MERPELIIPARFDSKDGVAGLKAVEESGHGEDVGQAGEVASAQFRKAHQSVQSALQEFSLLRRTLQQVPVDEGCPTSVDPTAREAARDASATVPPEEWLGSGEGLRAAGALLGRPATRPPLEQSGRLEQGSPPLLKMQEAQSQQDVGRSSLLPDSYPWGIPWRSDLPPEGGSSKPCDERSADSSVLRSSSLVALGRSQGLSVPDATLRGLGTGNRDRNETLAKVQHRLGFPEGAEDLAEESGGRSRAGRMTREVVADYADWKAGRCDSSRDGAAAIRPGGPTMAVGQAGARSRDVPAREGGVEPCYDRGLSNGIDPREAIWRMRATSPVEASIDPSIAEGRAMHSVRERAGNPPGARDPVVGLGVESTGAIERLLKEQNELIRQDLQRNSNHPIAAPPPLRGGGIRM